MRVLHLYAGNLYGGVERVLATLARERGRCPEMQPHFALCFDGRLARELHDAGCAPAMLGEARVSRPWTVAAARARLRDLLDRQPCDIAICHSAWPHGMFAPVIRARRLPLVFFAHDVPTGTGWLERWARRTPPDLVLVNSRFTAASVPKLFSGVRCEVQRYPVEPNLPDADHRPRLRSDVRAQHGSSEGDCVVLITARLERWKGHALLIDALSILRDSPHWQCWIAGGPQTPAQQTYLLELRKLASDRGIAPRVRFLGQRDDVPNLLVAADVHCQPNTGPEPFGVAFVESLAAGLPVVTTNMGAAPEIVTRDCGQLVSSAESAELAAALSRLIERSDLRSSLARAAPARAIELCDPDRVLPMLHERLSSLIRS